MQWSLFLLSLMGHCSLFTCHLYEYHFIKEKKTWKEAQTYCKDNYTDLATVFDMTDMERLRDSTEEHGDAWIGLRNKTGEREWHWSLPGVEFKCSQAKWADGEPNNNGQQGNCVMMDSGEWRDGPCAHRLKFICYDERKQPHETFLFMKHNLIWTQAQNYCRQHQTDLVSGLKCQNYLWIGLFRDTWEWSDKKKFSFRNWDPKYFSDNEETEKCAMTVSDGLKWGFDKCDEEKSFFCYEDKVILIKKEKTWTEALYYCREKHHDLVSITNLAEQKWVQETAKNANTGFIWLGLRYTCTLDLWFWISDEQVGYENWASEDNTDDCDRSAAMENGGEHKWHKKADNDKFNFICTRY